VPGYKGPACAGFELGAPRFQALGRVRKRVDADGNEVHVLPDFLSEFLLHACEGGSERRADSGAVGEDEIDCDFLSFDQVAVEMKRVSLLVQDFNIRNHQFLSFTNSDTRNHLFLSNGSGGFTHRLQIHLALRTRAFLRRLNFGMHWARVSLYSARRRYRQL